jgi:hypothetical protein
LFGVLKSASEPVSVVTNPIVKVSDSEEPDAPPMPPPQAAKVSEEATAIAATPVGRTSFISKSPWS